MVKENMKVGDIFEDNGRKYKVTKVVSDGVYESTANFVEEAPKRSRKKSEEE